MKTQPLDHRTLPRRRGRELEEAILAAALAELSEHGYPALTMESVAKRAGTGKASLYRRWETRAALVMDAVYTLAPSPQSLPDTGALRGDLLAALRLGAAALRGPAGEAMRGMLAEALPDAARSQALRARSQGRNRQLMAEVLRRASARGQVPDGAATCARLEVGAALLRNHFLFRGEPLDEDTLAGFVDEVLLPLFGTLPHSGRPAAGP